MKIIKLIFSLLFIHCQFSYCQFHDIETKFYDMFVFGSPALLSGKEDLRFHPAQIINSSDFKINLQINYHDLYREKSENNNYKSNFQYDSKMEAQLPLKLFEKNFRIWFDLQRQTLSFTNSSQHKEVELSGNNFNTYSFGGGILFDGITDKLGLNIKYSAGKGGASLDVNQFPEDNEDALLNKYFYDLLSPAFGNNILFALNGKEINYSFEYIKRISHSLNLGVNFNHESNHYDSGIKYFNSVKKIEEEKNLNGLMLFDRYITGLTGRYRINKLTFISSISLSFPFYKLSLNQDKSLVQNNVNVEILKLCNAHSNGKGIELGLGTIYNINKGMSVYVSYMFIKNRYPGQLAGSTPVLGYEILPIAHQVNLVFDNNMNNNLICVGIDHDFNKWNYSVSIEYLNSNNKLNYSYKILTEFGIGNSHDEQDLEWKLNLYKINLQTVFNVTNNIDLKLNFVQYIPSFKKNGPVSNVFSQAPTTTGNKVLNKNKWGGSIYSLALLYNFN